MTRLKISMAMAVATAAICTQANAQFYYPQQQQYVPMQQQYVPVQQQYVPVQPSPVQDIQGTVQPFSGTPFNPNDPSTFHGETSETAQDATAQRAWDPSQGYHNDDTVIAIEEPAAEGMVVFRYPAEAKAPLSYVVNDQKGTLAAGTNLTIPSGDAFNFSFIPASGKEAVAHDITTDGSYMFKSTDDGWKVVDYVAPQNDPALKKMMAEKEAAAKEKKMMAEKEAAAKREKAEMEAKAKMDAENKAQAEKAAMEEKAMAEKDAAAMKAAEMKAAEMKKAMEEKEAAETKAAEMKAAEMKAAEMKKAMDDAAMKAKEAKAEAMEKAVEAAGSSKK